MEVGTIINSKDGVDTVEYIGDSELDKDCFIGRDVETGEVHDDYLKDCFFME